MYGGGGLETFDSTRCLEIFPPFVPRLNCNNFSTGGRSLLSLDFGWRQQEGAHPSVGGGGGGVGGGGGWGGGGGVGGGGGGGMTVNSSRNRSSSSRRYIFIVCMYCDTKHTFRSFILFILGFPLQ